MKQPPHGKGRNKDQYYYPDGRNFQIDDEKFNQLLCLDTAGPRMNTRHGDRKYVTVVKDVHTTWKE